MRVVSAGSMVGLSWLMLTAAGCPLRNKEIRLTDDGMGWVIKACEPVVGGNSTGGNSTGGNPSGGNGWPGTGGGFPTPGGNSGGSWPPPPGPNGSSTTWAAGAGGASGTLTASPAGAGGTSGGPGGPNMYVPCKTPGHPYEYPTKLTEGQTDARLFLISPGDRRIQAASKCMRLHPCFDGGRVGRESCMASDINQQLDGAMPNGLGFDGLKNPEEAQLVLAFYQPTSTSEEDGGCHRLDMVACAGLAPPLGGGAYDVSCASCLNGPKTTQGIDNGPCPRDLTDDKSCFLQYCDDILDENGYD
jgi:hypothetical protein